MKNTFIIKIQVENDCYDYKKGDIIYLVVYSNSIRNAYQKVMEKYTGSEYPLFRFLEIIKEDKLFISIL